MLKRHDFDRVLKRTVQAEWNEILEALHHFSYFSSFNEIERRECCILSKIKVFPKDTIIVGGNIGNVNLVHFILKGEASMLVQLLIDQKSNKCAGEIEIDARKPFMTHELSLTDNQ